MSAATELQVYRRKSDGFMTQPISEATAKKMDGFAEGDFEVYKAGELPKWKPDPAPAPKANDKN